MPPSQLFSNVFLASNCECCNFQKTIKQVSPFDKLSLCYFFLNCGFSMFSKSSNVCFYFCFTQHPIVFGNRVVMENRIWEHIKNNLIDFIGTNTNTNSWHLKKFHSLKGHNVRWNRRKSLDCCALWMFNYQTLSATCIFIKWWMFFLFYSTTVAGLMRNMEFSQAQCLTSQ